METIDGMLRGYGYDGLAIGNLDSRHSDVDRMVIDFAHSPHSHTKILLCVTTAGEFTCGVGAVQSHTGENGLLIEQLSEVRLKEVLAKAVEECLSGKRDQSLNSVPPQWRYETRGTRADLRDTQVRIPGTGCGRS